MTQPGAAPSGPSPALGFGLPTSGAWATADAMATVAREAEAAGYHSLWTFQRLLTPIEHSWGSSYDSPHDPLVSLAYAAALTERVRLGVAVLNAPFTTPLQLAKAATTLDEVSAGRLDLGLGAGWAQEEFDAVGVPFARRGARFEEFLRCLTAIWTQDPVEFDGAFYRVPRSHVDPKPRQRPHPPVLLGGAAPAALRRVGRMADGWISASRADLRRIGEDIAIIREAATTAGRDPDRLRIVCRGVVRLTDGADRAGDPAARRPLRGSAEQIREDLAALAAAGVTEVFLDPNFDPAISGPGADPAESLRRAMHLLETFAPGR
ncbi:TIGR03619 family F420-dependent LLM class oxidoreductase [Nakamurella leprariae]|uniref:TIGR03619 family F420-dependent LLM class oxidoreductase n=1 Tax=Nakamurella leprariae TaxID=2803911 RepID=A0A938Y9L3_9ACTN|nr:TIGR03619 family F420-dependent LLM class oxidoreductase [Nakamurella leprariae]MBM9468390.1 TIGR03619 family F420-dependent LLM class oxidoreductase [Nakamurella leprariae]